jgi:hypothetical protein
MCQFGIKSQVRQAKVSEVVVGAESHVWQQLCGCPHSLRVRTSGQLLLRMRFSMNHFRNSCQATPSLQAQVWHSLPGQHMPTWLLP